MINFLYDVNLSKVNGSKAEHSPLPLTSLKINEIIDNPDGWRLG